MILQSSSQTVAPGESLSSWLHRQKDVSFVIKIKALLSEQSDVYEFDPDINCLTALQQEHKNSWCPSIDFDEFNMSSSWLIPYQIADFACHRCLSESLHNYHSLIFQKHWRRVTYPVCAKHKDMLFAYPPRNSDRENYLRFSSFSSFKTYLDVKAMASIASVALWCQLKLLAEDEDIQNNCHNPDLETAKRKRDARKFILELFLHSGEHSSGIATCFTSGRRTQARNRMHLGWRILFLIGPLESNSLERSYALVLLHIITGEIDHQDLGELIRNISSCGYVCSWAPFKLGSECCKFNSFDLEAIYRRLDSFKELFPSQAYCNFIEGFQS